MDKKIFKQKGIKKPIHIIANNSNEYGLIAKTNYNNLNSFMSTTDRLINVNINGFGLNTSQKINPLLEITSNVYILLEQYGNDSYATNDIQYHFHIVPYVLHQKIWYIHGSNSIYQFFESVSPQSQINVRLYDDIYNEIKIPPCILCVNMNQIEINNLHSEHDEEKNPHQHTIITINAQLPHLDKDEKAYIQITQENQIFMSYLHGQKFKYISGNLNSLDNQYIFCQLNFQIGGDKLIITNIQQLLQQGQKVKYIITEDPKGLVGKILTGNEIETIQEHGLTYVDKEYIIPKSLQKWNSWIFQCKCTRVIEQKVQITFIQKKITISFVFETDYVGEDVGYNFNNDFDAFADNPHPYSKMITQTLLTNPINAINPNILGGQISQYGNQNF